MYDDLSPSVYVNLRERLPELVSRACDKDPVAFGVLYVYYQRPLGRRLMSLVYNKEVTSDLYQDTFVRVWEAISQQVSEHFEAWLYRIARNLALDYLRHKRLVDFHPLPDTEAAERFAELSIESDEDRICELLCLKEAVDLMSPQYRLCLLLQVYWGYSQAEIAARIGISPKAVGTNVSRAYKQLQRHYATLTAALQRIETAADDRTGMFEESLVEILCPAWRLQKERLRERLLDTGIASDIPLWIKQLV